MRYPEECTWPASGYVIYLFRFQHELSCVVRVHLIVSMNHFDDTILTVYWSSILRPPAIANVAQSDLR